MKIDGIDAEAARVKIGGRAHDTELVAATSINGGDEKAERAGRFEDGAGGDLVEIDNVQRSKTGAENADAGADGGRGWLPSE